MTSEVAGALWMPVRAAVVSIVLACAAPAQAAPAAQPQKTAYARWQNGLSADPSYFPIAVWLQAPRNAKRYQKLGINLYVGLWQGPTEAQLAELAAARMPVICAQNQVGLTSANRGVIVGWMHGDEPDNAQKRKNGKGYGPPVAPKLIVDHYKKIRARDPSRPVLLNLGQGVAWDGWYGRGVRTNHPEDYPQYIRGCDIASFDIYPAVHRRPEVAGKLEFVPRGVSRLRKWSKGRKIVWNCIECTRISNPKVKPTPAQVRAEVWMALIHGSRGLIYFVHQFKPRFREAGLLDDADMVKEVTALNRQIAALAPVLNSLTIKDGAAVESANKDVPVAVMVKRHGGATYVFAAAMRGAKTTGTFRLRGARAGKQAEVLGESRTIAVKDGRFTDAFKPYGVHLYRIAP